LTRLFIGAVAFKTVLRKNGSHISRKIHTRVWLDCALRTTEGTDAKPREATGHEKA
jgi:hypothetical protein